MLSRIYYLLLFTSLLIGCDRAAPKADLPTTLKRSATTQAPAPIFTFCDPQRYPLRHLRFVSHTDDLDRAKGQRIPIRTLELLSGLHEVDTIASYPFSIFYHSYQFAHPNYCAFTLYNEVDDPFLELVTYNHRTRKHYSLTVSAWWSGADESHAGQGFIRFWPQRMSQFPNDTTILLIDRWTAKTMADSGGLRESPFFIDSIVTRYVIRTDGSFQRMERDSVRMMRTGDPAKYNGVPR